VLRRIREVVRPLPKAAMFALAALPDEFSQGPLG
jgi:hypothetical protein